MELKTERTVRLDQLQAELRALLGLSRLLGLSARYPDGANEVILVLDLDGPGLTIDEERIALEAVAAHVPDPMWGSDGDERALWSSLALPAGSLTVSDLETAFRALVKLMPIQNPALSPMQRED